MSSELGIGGGIGRSAKLKSPETSPTRNSTSSSSKRLVVFAWSCIFIGDESANDSVRLSLVGLSANVEEVVVEGLEVRSTSGERVGRKEERLEEMEDEGVMRPDLADMEMWVSISRTKPMRASFSCSNLALIYEDNYSSVPVPASHLMIDRRACFSFSSAFSNSSMYEVLSFIACSSSSTLGFHSRSTSSLTCRRGAPKFSS